MNKKIKPTFDLESIQEAVSNMAMKISALSGAAEMGMTRTDMETVICGLTNKEFYKSMTSYDNHKIWMDVYHGRTDEFEIYIKFARDEDSNFICTSFKEK